MIAYVLKISCPSDYRLWQQTMYCRFREKWLKLHRGPMWCTSSSAQDSDGDAFRTTQQHLRQKTIEVFPVNVCFALCMWHLSGFS